MLKKFIAAFALVVGVIWVLGGLLSKSILSIVLGIFLLIVGIALKNQWYQDDPSEWGEDLPYNEELGLWDGGELDGTCAITIDENEVEKAIDASNRYDGDHLYLIASSNAWGGNDYMEVLMSNAVVIAEFEA